MKRGLLPIGLALLAGAATAQYIGPSSAPVHHSVAEVLKSAADDEQVSLEGFLIRKVGSDKYIFFDGKAEIRVEIDNKLFPATPISDKTRLRIRGEVEKDFLESPEIDVEALEILSP